MIEGDIEILKMNAEASLLISELHYKAFIASSDQEWSEKAFREMLSIKGTNCYLVKRDMNPIGFALMRRIADEVEIITFCILPNECKNGYATLLLEWIIKDLQRQSIKRLFLEVRENNVAAIGLYKKCSFDIIGRRNGYYQIKNGENIDAIVMQRVLKSEKTTGL